jgi:hypothetical protein
MRSTTAGVMPHPLSRTVRRIHWAGGGMFTRRQRHGGGGRQQGGLEADAGAPVGRMRTGELFGERVAGVDQQVEQNLMQVAAVEEERGQAGRYVVLELDAAVERMAHEIGVGLDDGAEIELLGLVFALAAEGEEPAREIGRTAGGVGDHFQVVAQTGHVRPLGMEQIGIEQDRREQIVELVGNAADELADGAQAAALGDLRVLLFALGHILHEETAAGAVGGRVERHEGDGEIAALVLAGKLGLERLGRVDAAGEQSGPVLRPLGREAEIAQRPAGGGLGGEAELAHALGIERNHEPLAARPLDDAEGQREVFVQGAQELFGLAQRLLGRPPRGHILHGAEGADAAAGLVDDRPSPYMDGLAHAGLRLDGQIEIVGLALSVNGPDGFAPTLAIRRDGAANHRIQARDALLRIPLENPVGFFRPDFRALPVLQAALPVAEPGKPLGFGEDAAAFVEFLGLARDALAQLPLAHQRPERDDERQGQRAGDIGDDLFAGELLRFVACKPLLIDALVLSGPIEEGESFIELRHQRGIAPVRGEAVSHGKTVERRTDRFDVDDAEMLRLGQARQPGDQHGVDLAAGEQLQTLRAGNLAHQFGRQPLSIA